MLERLSYFWNRVQDVLFPHLREVLGDLLPHHERVVEVLSIVQVERFVAYQGDAKGRKQKDRQAIARAFVAKAVLNTPTTLSLIERLQTDYRLRVICGWDYAAQLPSESTFSRAFAEFSKSGLTQNVHAALVEMLGPDRCIMHLSRDATDVPARERPKPSKVLKEVRNRNFRAKRGEGVLDKQLASGKSATELLAEIPRDCDSGAKLSPKGSQMYWRGYKFHADIGDHGIPISYTLTSASVNDARVAIPLSMMSAKRVRPYYELMDKGYYAKAVVSYIQLQGRVALIPVCPKNSKAKLNLAQEQKARDALRFYPPEVVRFRNRTVVERFFSQLKDNYGGRFVRVRGNDKVMCHLGFGVLALTAMTLIRLL